MTESKHIPPSRDLLATLIELLADQENVNITYEYGSSKTGSEEL